MAHKGSQRNTSTTVGDLGRRELVCFTAADSGIEITASTARSAYGADAGPLADLASSPDITFRPLFGTRDRLSAAAMEQPAAEGVSASDMESLIADMSRCYHVEAPDESLEALAEQLNAMDVVESAYVKPPLALATITTSVPASRRGGSGTRSKKPKDAGSTEEADTYTDALLDGTRLNDMQPLEAESPPVSPDFVARQGYLNAAPAGIDARYAWTVPGGRGLGVRVIDCEWGWRFNHEDLRVNQGGVVVGAGSTDTNPGTAVLGEISGDINTYGITGIASDATVFGAAFSMPSAQVIQQAADRLSAGDIILLEIHRQGPGASGVGQDGYIAIEWWPDDFLAIRYASNRGVIVVEAAGNGARDLDNAIYDSRPASFPTWWVNPFRRTSLDSGAVIVGAGAPPPGTHGRDHGPDRSRLGFSNFGACVDAQGWGREVTTTGYGDLQGGSSPDLWYTDTFSGTSSASPIVVGALASVQGALRAAGRIPLSPGRARHMLRTTGSPQQDAPGRPRTQRIGNRPNLRQLIPAALAQGSWFGVQFRGRLEANQTQRWFTHSWPAHWHVEWSVVPTNPKGGGPTVEWTVRTERPSDYYVTYWIDIKNLRGEQTYFEARYAVLGW
jgi:hypothetical protein